MNECFRRAKGCSAASVSILFSRVVKNLFFLYRKGEGGKVTSLFSTVYTPCCHAKKKAARGSSVGFLATLFSPLHFTVLFASLPHQSKEDGEEKENNRGRMMTRAVWPGE